MADNFSRASDTADNDSRSAKVAVNSIDFVSHVKRLPVFRSAAQGIYLYGQDNNYPAKLKQLALRSNSLVTAINSQTKFLRGLGFPGAIPGDFATGNAVEVNADGLTAGDLLTHFAKSKSEINTAIHVNYNALGEAVGFTPVPYEFIRRKLLLMTDHFEKFVISNIWDLENTPGNYDFGAFTVENFNEWVKKKELGFNYNSLCVYAYDPDSVVVREQISESGGIENYPGQLFYSNNSIQIYQKAFYDSVIDDAQTEAEAKIFSISNLQNMFASSGIFKYPGNLDTQLEFKKVKERMEQTAGAVNAGRFFTIPFNPGSPPTTPFFESIQQQNVDTMFVNQREDAKRNIYEFYQQPGLINGRSDNGMFNQQSMSDAFTFYNSVTEPLRQEIEKELTMLFSNSIIDIQLPIQIEPLNYKGKTTETNETTD